MQKKQKSIEDVQEELRGKWKPKSNSGKTRFNRMKASGQSWTDLRDKEQKAARQAK